MHPGHSSLGHNFLNEMFPRMHMVLYNATSEVKGFNEKAMAFINDLKEKGDSMINEGAWKGEQRFMARRGLGVLAKLYEKGYDNILAQYQQGLNHKPVASAADGLVLQIRPTSRWEKKYEAAAAHDVVMAVPSWGKVVAFSTTDMVLEGDPGSIKRYERLHIENFHFYPFFNRAHGVRGRRVVQGEPEGSNAIHFLQDFSFLLRTCSDAVMIGKSCCLSAFTPVETLRGLQLGFYFMVICKVTAIHAARAAGGFGANLGMTRLTLSDGQGEFQADLNTQIFLENMSLPFNKEVGDGIRDPLKLAEYPGWILVLCAWLFGHDTPSVAAIQFLGDRADAIELLFQAFVRTRRKVALEPDIMDWKRKVGKDLTSDSRNVVVYGKWVYYKENDWADPVFVAAIRNQFKILPFSDIVKTGASYSDCRNWEQSFHSYVRVNPEILNLYLAENPSSMLQGLYPADPRGERFNNDQLSGLYKCANCKMAFKEFQFQPGRIKRCTKCGSTVEPFQQEEKELARREVKTKRAKASRFLGSDPWLRSLFD